MGHHPKPWLLGQVSDTSAPQCVRNPIRDKSGYWTSRVEARPFLDSAARSNRWYTRFGSRITPHGPSPAAPLAPSSSSCCATR